MVAVPQFHENFVLTGSLAFNLLMGLRWPPTAADLAEAAALCDDLGLGELIALFTPSDSNRWWAKAAGNSLTANAAASSSPGRCCRMRTC
ncbi:MAG: hypothetical protein R3A10_06265 [Caldilineaceae bacterium]